MIEKCIVHKRETTVKHGRLTWRRWYGTTMSLHSAFEQRKGSGLVFFPVWDHSRLWPQNQKKASPDPFHENMVRKVYTAKIPGPYQVFYGSGPIFFCAVNRALACRRLLFLSLHRIFLSVSNSRILIFLENAGFLFEQKDNLKKYHC